MGGGKEAKRRRALERAGVDPKAAAKEAAKELKGTRLKQQQAVEAAEAKRQTSEKLQRKHAREKRKKEAKAAAGATGAKRREQLRLEVIAQGEVPGQKRKKGDATSGGSKKVKGDPWLTVFVGQLPFTADDRAVEEHFVKAGIENVTSVRMLTEKETKKPRGMAFVQLTCETDVLAALELHQSEFEGRWINVERCKRKHKDDEADAVLVRPQHDEASRGLSVFIGQLPYSADANFIREHFENSGVEGVQAVKMLSEKGTNRKGMAFLKLSDEAGVQAALQLHQTQMSGRLIVVERSGKQEAKDKKAKEEANAEEEE